MQQAISDNQNRSGILSLLSGGGLCGTLGLFTTHLLAAGATPMMTAFLRCFFGAVFMIPFVLFTNGPKGFRLTRKELGGVLLIGVVGLGLYNYCYMSAMQELGIASAAVLDYTAPGFLVLLSAVFFRDRLTPRRILAVLLNFGGCAVMVTGGNFSELTFSPFGLFIGLMTGLSFALNNLFTRAFARDMSPFTLTFYGFLFGSVFLAFFVSPWLGFGYAPTMENILITAGFGLIPTAIGFGAYYRGVLLVRDKAMAPVISSVENITACLLGFIVLGEYFNLWKAAGIILVLISIFMIARSNK